MDGPMGGTLMSVPTFIGPNCLFDLKLQNEKFSHGPTSLLFYS